MKPQAQDGVPLIIEGTNVMDVEKWGDISYLADLLGDKPVLVKRSATKKFRYFDLKKNVGKFNFEQPVKEVQMKVQDFLAEGKQILREGQPQECTSRRRCPGTPRWPKSLPHGAGSC
eukprot:SRR837773.15593.p2 GENE.SRR837773.15593~~SRR837773.15593.p2  ORF type:complete len:126 (-),score=28.29 SRR837773.15593:123-473(-)